MSVALKKFMGIMMSAGGYDPNAQTIITSIIAGGGTLSNAQKGYVNTVVVRRKQENVWVPKDILYGFMGGNAGGAAVNWKSPGTNDITWHGNIDFTNGILGDGTGWGDTGKVPDKLLNNHFTVYSLENGDYGENTNSIAASDGDTDNYSLLQIRRVGDLLLLANNSTFTNRNNTNSQGYFSVGRDTVNGDGIFLRKDGGYDSFYLVPATNLSDTPFGILGIAASPSMSTRPLGSASYGDQLDVFQSVMDADIDWQLQVSLGRITNTFSGADVYMGDSITAAYVITAAGGLTWAAQYSIARNTRCLNMGLSGTRLDQAIGKVPYKQSYMTRLWISFGTNDVLAGITPTQYQNYLTTITAEAISKGWAANDIIINCIYFQDASSGRPAQEFIDLATAAGVRAASLGCRFVNPYSLPGYTKTDALHPDQNGHNVLAAYYIAQIS